MINSNWIVFFLTKINLRVTVIRLFTGFWFKLFSATKME